MNIISVRNRIVDMVIVNDMVVVSAVTCMRQILSVLLQVWSYGFFDTTISTE